MRRGPIRWLYGRRLAPSSKMLTGLRKRAAFALHDEGDHVAVRTAGTEAEVVLVLGFAHVDPEARCVFLVKGTKPSVCALASPPQCHAIRGDYIGEWPLALERLRVDTSSLRELCHHRPHCESSAVLAGRHAVL